MPPLVVYQWFEMRVVCVVIIVIHTGKCEVCENILLVIDRLLVSQREGERTVCCYKNCVTLDSASPVLLSLFSFCVSVGFIICLRGSGLWEQDVSSSLRVSADSFLEKEFLTLLERYVTTWSCLQM